MDAFNLNPLAHIELDQSTNYVHHLHLNLNPLAHIELDC